jgi:hypothetical protein
MSDKDAPIGTCCCMPTSPGVRRLTFPDGIQVGIVGLDETFAVVYAEGWQVSTDTAEEIVGRLTAKNYISPSARQRYCDLIIQEYGKYVKRRADNSQK